MKLRPLLPSRSRIEPLEARIAPALTGLIPAVVNSAILVKAGQGLSASQDGPLLLYVQKGEALVYTKDLNNNGKVDFNEITGISAGDGLSLTSFVDIHGDIVTNLTADGTLTDSDNNAANGRDGQVLLNSRIDKIVLRSVTAADLAPNDTVANKIALSSYSIFGNIYAGGGFGTPDGQGGLVIDDTGKTVQQSVFDGTTGNTLYVATTPQIGSIRVGTAASGESFGFGASAANDVRGTLMPFAPPANSPGADINGIHAANKTTLFDLGDLQAGDGGFNGRGGNIANVQVTGDTAGGYSLIAGNGGSGPTGQVGGSILNYSDLGSITSQIVLQTGNGGVGLLKTGGNGGSLTLDPANPINLAGHVIVTLGHGGDGVTGGGAGGSQPAGTFTTPETLVPYGGAVVTSEHLPGDIFNQKSDVAPGSPGYHVTRGIDFNGDGINDEVYTSTQGGTQGSQLIVLLGSTDPKLAGQFDHQHPIYLNGPANATALTVGDFNGDGHPDIAVASGNSSYAGIEVFLSKYDKLDGHFVGFSDPIYNDLPSLGGVTFAATISGVTTFGTAPQTGYKITNLVSGDFNGDGVADLAAVTTLGLMPLLGDANPGPNGAPSGATGHFYVDPNTDVFNFGPAIPLAAKINAVHTSLRPSALKDGGTDHLFAANEGDTSIVNFTLAGNVFNATTIGLGSVDTNRQISDPGKTDKIALTEAALRDFTVLDVNGDGNADLVATTKVPGGYIVAQQGDGAGGFTFTSNAPVGAAGENAGIKVGGDPTSGGLGLNVDSLVGIMAANTAHNPNGAVTGITLIDYNSDTTDPGQYSGIHVIEFTFSPAAGGGNTYQSINEGATYTAPDGLGLTGDQSIRAFDTYVPNSAHPDAVTYSYLQAQKNNDKADFEETFRTTNPSGLIGGEVDFLQNYAFHMTAGAGGAASNGPGGAGGKLGSTLAVDKTSGLPKGALSLTLPMQEDFRDSIRFTAGDGGDGFSSGGAGGNLQGISVAYTTGTTVFSSHVFMFAGSGGDSSNGHAGNGGSLSALSIIGGNYFVAGHGGDGKMGGAGGSVTGNNLTPVDTTVGSAASAAQGGGFASSQTSVLVVQSGAGGSGTKSGGDGGSISGFNPEFLPIIGGSGGLLYYLAGNGGSSIGGTGGRGGSIVNSAPFAQNNFLDGDVFVSAGSGGQGKAGGAGGSISGFQNTSAPDISVSSMTFLGGNGGRGTGGTGGAGGSVSGVSVSGTGVGFQYYFDFSHPQSISTELDGLQTSVDPITGQTYPASNLLPYARVVAGRGGDSSGGAGGAGGAVSTIQATSTSSAFAVIAGAGGDGLTLGGLGGSLTTVSIGAGSTGKVLAAAGDGGDAYGSKATAANPLGFGGVDGTGGNGGSITHFLQSGATDVNVDLIAGNGGSTINSGSTQALVANVGNGGSITDAQVTGNIGKGADPSDVTVAIKAYNNIAINQRFSDFVETTVVGAPTDPGFALQPLDDSVGNVGIVVGSRGRVQDNNHDGVLDPASAGTNGSLINVHASTIMSAVAGSVDRIASIHVLQNVGVTRTGGAFGSDKTVDSTGSSMSPDGVQYHLSSDPALLDYLTAAGKWSNKPILDGKLVDGAIIADTVRTPQSVRDFNPNV